MSEGIDLLQENEDQSILQIVLKYEATQYKCRVCGNPFQWASNRRRHEVKFHGFHPAISKVFKCRECSHSFSTASNRRRHEKQKHNFKPPVKQILKCSECLNDFKTKQEIMTHFPTNHPDIKLQREEKVFQNKKEFENWKLSVEKNTTSWFVSKRSNINKEHKVKEYFCHRSGSFQGETNESKRKRRMKFSGSNKSGFFCPASMIVREGATYNVTFVSTHVGHRCEVGRLPLFVAKLVIDETPNTEASELEKAAICKQIGNQGTENLKEKAKAALLGFIPKLNTFNSEAQCNEIIKTISVLESKCLALATTEKEMPPVVLNSAPTKNIECQRYFPLKKKRKVVTSCIKRRGNSG